MREPRLPSLSPAVKKARIDDVSLKIRVKFDVDSRGVGDESDRGRGEILCDDDTASVLSTERGISVEGLW